MTCILILVVIWCPRSLWENKTHYLATFHSCWAAAQSGVRICDRFLFSANSDLLQNLGAPDTVWTLSGPVSVNSVWMLTGEQDCPMLVIQWPWTQHKIFLSKLETQKSGYQEWTITPHAVWVSTESILKVTIVIEFWISGYCQKGGWLVWFWAWWVRAKPALCPSGSVAGGQSCDTVRHPHSVTVEILGRGADKCVFCGQEEQESSSIASTSYIREQTWENEGRD